MMLKDWESSSRYFALPVNATLSCLITSVSCMRNLCLIPRRSSYSLLLCHPKRLQIVLQVFRSLVPTCRGCPSPKHPIIRHRVLINLPPIHRLLLPPNPSPQRIHHDRDRPAADMDNHPHQRLRTLLATPDSPDVSPSHPAKRACQSSQTWVVRGVGVE